MTCNLTPHPFSSMLYSHPTPPLPNNIPTHHNTTINDITVSFMEGNAIHTNLHQVNDSPLPLELPRVQETHQNFQETQTTISTHQEQDSESKNDSNCSSSDTLQANHHEVAVNEVHVVEEASTGRGGGGDVAEVVVQGGEECCGRERLKRHRVEVAGRVCIPDIWGQEELLNDWIDCNAFDATEVSSGLMSARASLIREGRRANSGRLRIENRCS